MQEEKSESMSVPLTVMFSLSLILGDELFIPMTLKDVDIPPHDLKS